MNMLVIVNLVAFIGLIIFLARLGGPDTSLSRRILAGLGVGIAFGLVLQFAYSGNPDVIFE